MPSCRMLNGIQTLPAYNATMKPRVYVETSVISYLTARPSRDLIMAAHQEVTREWWQNQRSAFDLFYSEAVRNEAAMGDSQAAAQHLAKIARCCAPHLSYWR